MKEKIRIGIMPYEDYKKRTMEIAAGKRKRKADEPKVWFPSIESAMQVLSTKNQKLLRTIIDKKPDSISTLGKLTGSEPPRFFQVPFASEYPIPLLLRYFSDCSPLRQFVHALAGTGEAQACRAAHHSLQAGEQEAATPSIEEAAEGNLLSKTQVRCRLGWGVKAEGVCPHQDNTSGW